MNRMPYRFLVNLPYVPFVLLAGLGLLCVAGAVATALLGLFLLPNWKAVALFLFAGTLGYAAHISAWKMPDLQEPLADDENRSTSIARLAASRQSVRAMLRRRLRCRGYLTMLDALHAERLDEHLRNKALQEYRKRMLNAALLCGRSEQVTFPHEHSQEAAK